LCAMCFALSSVGMLFAGNLHQFVVWRLIGGLGIGAASVIAPNYIAEIAPTRVRGRCVTLYQLGIVVGILSAVFVNMLIQRMGDEAWNISTGWRWMFLAGVVPAIFFGAMIIPAVESPRWLMKVGRRDQAIEVLTKINGPDAAARDREIENFAGDRRRPHLRACSPPFGVHLLLGIMLAGLQQISGITPIFSFLPEIFRAAGTATTDAFFQSVLVSLVNLLFTLFALWLVDRAGRKTLILAGTSLQFVSLALVGWFYHIHGSGLAVLIFVMSFVAGTPSATAWPVGLSSRKFIPQRFAGVGCRSPRPRCGWWDTPATSCFPSCSNIWDRTEPFWVFSGGAALTLIFVSWLIPETKGRSLEQITKFWTEENAPAISRR
jgi:SP family arabinose:H+ symporter-like MFS transporter